MNNVQLFLVTAFRKRRLGHRHFRTETLLRRFVVRHARLLLGVQVFASEYPITTNGGGRIDAIGLDDAGNPVILEFKRVATGLAICQGLFYIDWLDHHRDRFVTLVNNHLGAQIAARVTWHHPRLICLAEEIDEREEAVARQIGRCVELVRLRRLPRGLVILQHWGKRRS